MTYKLGLKLWSTNTEGYLREAQRLYALGVYDYIELYIVPNTLDTLDKWSKLKIPFVIHCPHFAHGFNLAKKEKKKSNQKIYKEVKEFADKLSAKYIIFHGGIDGNIEETAQQLSNLKEPRALIENKPYRALPNKMNGTFCRGYNLEEIGYVKEISKCGFCLDIGHAICSANSQKNEPYAYVKSFLELNPDMFHLTDNTDITSEFDSHPHLGTGELDLSKIKKILPVNAIITLETIKDENDKLNDFINDIKIIRNITP